MKEHYVSYEQAVKLKEFGFEGNGLKNYIRQGYYKFPNGYISPIKHDSDGILIQFRKEDAERIPAPRLDQVQKWLREVKHIYVYPEINCLKKWFAKAVDMERNEDLIWDSSMFDTYEDALSYGIVEALTILTNKS